MKKITMVSLLAVALFSVPVAAGETYYGYCSKLTCLKARKCARNLAREACFDDGNADCKVISRVKKKEGGYCFYKFYVEGDH